MEGRKNCCYFHRESRIIKFDCIYNVIRYQNVTIQNAQDELCVLATLSPTALRRCIPDMLNTSVY